MTKDIIRKILAVLILFILIIAGLSINSFAAEENYTCNITLVPEKSEILAGETVTIDIEVSDIQAGNGIAIIAALFENDNDTFEENFKIEKDDEGKWNNTVLENFVTFQTANYEGTIEDGVIGKIILTAKQDATLGEKEVKLTKIDVTSDDNVKFQLDDVVGTVEIVEETEEPEEPTDPEDPGEPEDPEEPEDPNDDKPGNNNNNNNGNNNNQKPKPPTNTGEAETTLPKTGSQSFLVLGIIGAVAISVICYIKYRRSY